MNYLKLASTAVGVSVLLSGAQGCKRLMAAKGQARRAPAIEAIAVPPLPPVDPAPSLRKEVDRLEERVRQQRDVRERLERLTLRLDRLFRADAVSAGRPIGLDTVVTSLESAPETVKVSRVVSIENRWTIEIQTGEKPEEPEPRPSQLFAESLRLAVPAGSTVEYVRNWQAGPDSFILGFTYPSRVNRAADAPRAPLHEDRLPAALQLDPVLPEGADAPEGRPAITGPETRPEPDKAQAADAGAATAAAEAAPVDAAVSEVEALEAKIANLTGLVDEKTLVEDRKALLDVELALDLLDKRRLARQRNGALRLAASDVERMAEVAGLRGGVATSRGASRLGVLHAETVELTGQGALSTLVGVFEAVDTAGALVGNLELNASEDGLWDLRVDLHLLGR